MATNAKKRLTKAQVVAELSAALEVDKKTVNEFFIDISKKGLEERLDKLYDRSAADFPATAKGTSGLAWPAWPYNIPTVKDSGVTYSKIDVDFNYGNACGVTTAGQLKCWGKNQSDDAFRNSCK